MPPYGEPRQTTRRIILGKSGSGKTTLARLHSWHERTLIIAPHRGDWQAPNVSSVQAAARRMRASAFRFALVPDETRPESFFDAVSYCSEYLYAVGDALAVIDELDMFWPSRAENSGIQNLVLYGRNRGIDFVGTTRRPSEVHRKATSQATEFDIFFTEEPADVDWIRAYCGGQIAALVKMLPARYAYVHFDLISRKCWTGRT